MPDHPRRPDPSWTPEVDRLLKQLDPRPTPAPAPTAARRLTRTAPRPRPGAAPQKPPTFWLPSPRGVWARVGLGAMLAIAMTQWPYRYCGWPLAGYFAAVAVVLVAGAWAGYSSWRRRMGLAHLVALALVFAGTALVALEVLPRLGYAPVEVAWTCVTPAGGP